MSKITKKTAKIGQKCVNVSDMVVYNDYKWMDNHRVTNEQNGFNHPNGNSCEKAIENTYEIIDKRSIERLQSYSKIHGGNPHPIFILKKGTELEIVNGKNQWRISLSIINGEHKGKVINIFDFSNVNGKLETAHFEDLSLAYNEAPKYKIFMDDKPYKPKIFSDLGKVKASLMDAMGYTDKLYKLNQNYTELSPEISYCAPEWIGGWETLKREDFKRIKVYEWMNRKQGKEADFNALEYYDELMDYVAVTARFGSSVRELYKKYKSTNEYTTILCFKHEDYRSGNYVYYEDLKESDIIKDAIKNSKIKDFKKCTKSGKTALVLKTQQDAVCLMNYLEDGTYFLVDIQGDELLLKDGYLIKHIVRKQKLNDLLKGME